MTHSGETEQVRQCGVRAARQCLARKVDEVDAFLSEWNPLSPWKAVVKPLDSAGSDDVYLVASKEEARKCFQIIDGKVRTGFTFCNCFFFSYRQQLHHNTWLA